MASLVTPTELREYLGGLDQGESDALLGVLLEAATQQLERATHRYFGATNAALVEVKDGSGTSTLTLRNEPTGGVVTSVEIRSATSWTTVDATLYLVKDNRVIYLGSEGYYLHSIHSPTVGTAWPMGQANIRVTYPAGYTRSTLPAAAAEAILSLAAHKYQARATLRPTEAVDEEQRGVPRDVREFIEEWREADDEAAIPRLLRA